MNEKEQSIACDLTAIPADVREEHILTAPQLFLAVQEVQELSDGYAFRFLNEPGKFMAIAKYIEHERLCCAFLNFELEVKPNGGTLWLRLTGGEGIKELLRSGLLEKSSPDKDNLKKFIQPGGDPHFDQLIAQASLPDLTGVLDKP